MIDSLKNNKLIAKSDFEDALLKMCNKIMSYFSPGKAFLLLPNYVATQYEDSTLYLEAFARFLWGIAPYSKNGKNIEVLECFKEGILNGTNPCHPEYWGDLKDYDQRAVEMPPIAFFLYFSKNSFWDKLTEDKKKNIERWLLQINHKRLVQNNWLFFRVLVNVFLKQIGAQYSEKTIQKDLLRIEKFYLGNGWYSDGKTNRRDYYISWAFHFYSLIYARVMEQEDIERSYLYKKRAKEFAQDFVYWFSEDGSALPFGRSLTYRFAQVAFWSAVVFAGVDAFPLGVIKGIICRHLRWWFRQPIFDKSGLLTVGYSYPNLIMSESYNGTGSPYWALKSFLIIGIENDHPFWKVKEERLPVLNSKVFQKYSRMTICRKSYHIAAFVNGQDYGNQIHSIAKYEKFVYSNVFGFSIPRSAYGVVESAPDSTLAVSEDGEIFKQRHNLTAFYNNEKVLYSRWNPWNNVEIESYVLPGLPWHVRVHKIQTHRRIILQEGGFSIERQTHLHPPVRRNIVENGCGVGVSYNEQHSGIISLLGNGTPKIIFPSPNTNLLYPRTELPILMWKFSEGSYVVISGILGDSDILRNDKNFWDDTPKVEMNNVNIKIFMDGINRSAITLDLDKKYRIPSSLNREIYSLKTKVRIFIDFLRKSY